VKKFDQDGPNFASVNLRATYRLPLGRRAGVDLIAEAFNLFNRTNWDVNSVQSGEALSGPTLQNPGLALNPNPKYGRFISTLSPLEFQLGVKLTF
jgi:outer membrane receptor protein involved in Fe transport